MNGLNGSSEWVDWAAAWWWFPLLLAPGLWLCARLYLHGPSRHRAPAFVYATAWLLLALWVVSPTWRSRPEIWHPPLVILAVDESPGFAALGARDSGRAARQAARRHYESLGFRVVETGFRERLPGEGEHPNLQALLVWSDGRSAAMEDPVSVSAFPVPTEVPTVEVQGESAFVAAGDQGRGAVLLTVAWRAWGEGGDGARAELLADGDVVWSGMLEHPPTARAGDRVTSEFPLPAGLVEAAGRGGAKIVLVVRPRGARDNFIAANDTITVDASRLHRALQAFVRPVTTLPERGLMDALREEPAFRVAAMTAAQARARPDDALIWVAAGREESIRAVGAPTAEANAAARPVIAYRIAPPARTVDASGGGAFGPDARIERASEVAPYLPAGVLRLADLGFAKREGESAGTWRLPAPNEGVEPLAWAVQDGRRGLLLWRDRARGTFGFVVPPIWDARFQPSSASHSVAVSLASAWARGAAAGVLTRHAQGDAASPASRATPSQDVANRGIRLGTDTEALARLAARAGGRVLDLQSDSAEVSWPDLPDGQIRETRARALALAPPLPAALAVSLLLAGVWAWRKRRQLD